MSDHDVIVIGGGSVAFDVARSVIRQAPQIDTMSPETLRSVLHEATDTLEHLTEGEEHGPEDMKVALDVARQLLRTGVHEVHMYCLESMEEIPATAKHMETTARAREAASRIIDGEDDRLLIIVGPCSVHDPAAGIEY